MDQQPRSYAGRASQHNPFGKLASNEWNPKFSTCRKDVIYKRENERLIDIRDLEGGLVRSFMKNYDESESCLPRSDMVEDYCFDVSWEGLQDDDKGGKVILALLDVRGKVGEKDRARKYRGPLTARDLCRQLMKPSYPDAESSCRRESVDITDDMRYQSYPSLGSDSDSGSDYSRERPRPDDDLEEYDLTQAPEPNAERKKIFITDLDRWAIYALMVTASESQAQGLRDAIFLHLSFETFIGVTFPSAGLAMYQLAFHIPFFAWRMSKEALEDDRHSQNDTPLRKTHDVSFLNWSSTGASDFLYEAQYSCLVAGTDETHWVAYGFFDTYFDKGGEARETAEGYHEDSLGEDGALVDPLAFGSFEAERATPKAREYWLCVFRIRLHHIVHEWEQVVKKLGQSICEYYKQTHIYNSRLSGPYRADKDLDGRVRRSRDWVVLVETLTEMLIQQLSKTVEACENFCQYHALCFQNLCEPPNGDRLGPAIQRSFDRLESLRKELKYSRERCAGFAKQLKLVIAFENNKMTIENSKMTDLQHELAKRNSKMSDLQHELAMKNKKLTYIVLGSIPIQLATQFLSMQQNFIAFIPNIFGSFAFFGLVVIFAVPIIFILVGFEIPNFQKARKKGTQGGDIV